MNSLEALLKEMFAKDDVGDSYMREDNVCKDELDQYGIESEMVCQKGGMDQGSTYYTVWKFSRNGEDVYVRFDGYYASHYGTDYEGFSFVTPKEKVITVYE